jgi:hypothetical protein
MPAQPVSAAVARAAALRAWRAYGPSWSARASAARLRTRYVQQCSFCGTEHGITKDEARRLPVG